MLVVFLQPFCSLSVLCNAQAHSQTPANNTSPGLQLCWWSFYSLSAACQYCVPQKHFHTNTRNDTLPTTTAFYSLSAACLYCVLVKETHSHKHQQTTHHRGLQQSWWSYHTLSSSSCSYQAVCATNSSKPHTTKAAVCTVFSDLV